MCNEICYGALFDAHAKPCGSKDIRKLAASQAANLFSTFELVESSKGMFHLMSEKIQTGILDVQTTSKLTALRHISGVRYEAIVENRIAFKRKAKQSYFEVSINIFGPRSSSNQVSKALSKVHAFLQHPHALSAGVEYHNPDMLIFPGQKVTMNEFIGASNADSGESRLSKDVRGILESLSQDTLVVEGDEFGHLDGLNGLTSTLTKHQKKGVRFFLQREDDILSGKLSKTITHITGTDETMTDGTLPGLGGLIADVMGLGKTLTTLASILHSAVKAEDFPFFDHSPGSGLSSDATLTKATLVIVPSVQLMESWEAEITTHFAKDALSNIRFHGTNRPQTVEALTAPDIVITTYATLVADHDGLELLSSMEWYRVVLDEAHEIRNPTTKQWKAAVNLRTRRRWCLSGTPIQNKMEDLAALAGFLQLRPLVSKDSFEREVLRPLSDPSTNSKPLRAYMEAYCLRRSESCLSLPASRAEVVSLHLTPPERLVYDEVLGLARRQIDDLVSSGKKVPYNQLFISLLRMRMICNSGTFAPVQGSTDSLTTRSHLKLSEALRNQCERCSGSDEGIRMLLSASDVCPDCMRPLHQRSPSPMFDLASQSQNVAASPASGSEFSTKLNAVVERLLSARNPESKAIVFSYFKTTLHILARLLGNVGVVYLQVDGDASSADRSSRLQAFKEDPTVHVLLMTVGTGAVGLNLTVATQVHIVEPQWNPSVEEQAVARAVRMGQKREVTVYRYVLQNTVEQNVVNLQVKKRNLARYTLGGSKSEQSMSNAVQELESVLELNPRKRGFDE